ncbi:PP2C family protein-serine/threonine phosphatase [Streptomyces sp. NPDC051776]|uniref:PP2C family protein-serine/threonine phosphatase n=1 Tax=Streptomyces sp. NPDC051776 TaxID=3155414 RepID=UPI003428DE16
MNSHHPPKVAGIDPVLPAPSHNASPAGPSAPHRADPAEDVPPAVQEISPVDQLAAIQDRLAGWISDLTTLHELTERLARIGSLDAALHELLRAGAALVGAQRGLIVLRPADGRGPETTVGLGLGPAELGTIETIPRSAASYGRILDGLPEHDGGARTEVAHPDLRNEPDLDPRQREVAARLGYAASYAIPLATESAGRLGAAVWLYDEPTEPVERQRHLVGLYTDYATEHLARELELARARATADTIREELLPSRLPRIPGVRLAVRHRTGPRGGGDWYDALPLPEGALGLAVGSVTGSGPSAVAAMGRLRASLRAYAVMEGEDPVAVLSDLELLLRLTEPARSATALFAYCEPSGLTPDAGNARHVVLAGAGHCPPLVIGDHRAEFVETSLSAPLGMLSCWEAPSVEFDVEPGETVLVYSDGLLHRTGEPMDRAFARLHAAAASVPATLRDDPDAVADHVLHSVLPDGRDAVDDPEDVVLLAARFDVV